MHMSFFERLGERDWAGQYGFVSQGQDLGALGEWLRFFGRASVGSEMAALLAWFKSSASGQYPLKITPV